MPSTPPLLDSFLRLLLSCLLVHGSPLSSSSSSSSSLSSSSSSISSSSSSSVLFSSDTFRSGTESCEPLEISKCAPIYASTQLPNVYGHFSQGEARQELDNILSKFSRTNAIVVTFLCSLYLPPCPDGGPEPREKADSGPVKLPCRPMCEAAMTEGLELLKNTGKAWPVRCQTLPTEHCYNFDGPNRIKFVRKSLKASGTLTPFDDVIQFAPLDVELGNDDGYEVEVVSLSTNQIPSRRYDTADLGDPDYFQGWADVQGTGSANDYCRVIGKGKRRFLSCHLSGSTGQGHHYVSKLGFETGHPHTWFMRDMDSDGRDDYCRCVGPKHASKVTCMKAGEKGFYGSTTQGGSENSFNLPQSGACHNKKVNPIFGE